jgi:putative NIF3 family GTP cyclohydrolase 1 type 2
MSNTILSRRRFGLAAGAFAAAQIPAPCAVGASAQDLVKRIQDALGGDWPENSPDGFKAGDPQHPVRGIATTAMATMAVLRQSQKIGLNLIVTHEPTFFGREDGPSHSPVTEGRGRGPGPVSAEDPIYLAKKDFIEKNGMVVWRLRDHWKARKENDLTAGLGESLGWTRYRDSADEAVYAVPAATLEETVAIIRGKLNLRGGLRAVGDRKARVHRVLLQPGLMPVKTMLERFSEIDLIVAGEVREWECVHYAADMNAAGEKKSLITIGRVVSEDPGMRSCAHWLKSVVSGVPIQWITAGDPYWRAA